MKLCNTCNQPIDDNDRICRHCGAPQDTEVQNSEQSVAVPKQTKSNTVAVAIIIAITVIVVAIVAAITVVKLNSSKPAANTEISTVSTTAPSTETTETTTTTTTAATTEKKTSQVQNVYNYNYYYDRYGHPQGEVHKDFELDYYEDWDYLYPSDQYLLTTDFLDTKSTDEVNLIRNEIYARHGYIFKKAKYRNYFENKAWYSPNESDMSKVEKRFNSTERKNIAILVKYQNL